MVTLTNTVLAIVGAVFDAFFGFIYWAFAWFRMRSADIRNGRRTRNKQLDFIMIGFNALVIVLGLAVFLSMGTYASVVHIRRLFAEGSLKGAFSCASTAL